MFGEGVFNWITNGLPASPEIVELFMAISPVIAVTQIFDFALTVESGILRSMGYQKILWVAILIMFCFATPLSYWMTFMLDFGLLGAYLGLSIGVTVSSFFY